MQWVSARCFAAEVKHFQRKTHLNESAFRDESSTSLHPIEKREFPQHSRITGQDESVSATDRNIADFCKPLSINRITKRVSGNEEKLPTIFEVGEKNNTSSIRRYDHNPTPADRQNVWFSSEIALYCHLQQKDLALAMDENMCIL